MLKGVLSIWTNAMVNKRRFILSGLPVFGGGIPPRGVNTLLWDKALASVSHVNHISTELIPATDNGEKNRDKKVGRKTCA